MLVGVPGVRILNRHGHDRAGLQIDGMLGFMGQMRPLILNLVIFASGSSGCVQSSFDPFLPRPIEPRRSSRVGVSMPDACASCVKNS